MTYEVHAPDAAEQHRGSTVSCLVSYGLPEAVAQARFDARQSAPLLSTADGPSASGCRDCINAGAGALVAYVDVSG